MLLLKRTTYLVNLMILTAVLLFSCFSANALEQVKVMALFKDKAMLSIDGQNRLLRAGQTSPEGVMLVAADPHEAVIEIDGERQSYQLGSAIHSSYQKREQREVIILRDNNRFYTTGFINGQQVNMVVDTGATSVALNEADAKRLGLQYRLKGQQALSRTASGIAKTYLMMLDKVQVGEITLNNVEGAVILGAGPSNVLLGMSFLNRVEMQNEGDKLILRNKF